MYYIVSGRNDQPFTATSVVKSKHDAMKTAFLYVELGYDWIEVFYHDEGSFAFF